MAVINRGFPVFVPKATVCVQEPIIPMYDFLLVGHVISREFRKMDRFF